MFKKAIPQHKRLAQGGAHCPLGYKRGGTVASKVNAISVNTGGEALNPLTTIKRQNGIPGHKKGGSVK